MKEKTLSKILDQILSEYAISHVLYEMAQAAKRYAKEYALIKSPNSKEAVVYWRSVAKILLDTSRKIYGE